ncbi:enoyl-CoA hydratase-related protein [Paralcaligenes sp. KSB-10]|uniref:enoyl-CoA hydratase-related protein n=1 Tax=Paralcaligenes sp. KSB-10 TaxID=2901142 RepID=UPI001E3E840C|nr:enoyl-CoA hydratase-related protein [Paralcaligenes sp. KSB-10]UHL62956.1 enoyl-CoA hydratase-related protein [Paralcaligenes sp. KSB-10]
MQQTQDMILVENEDRPEGRVVRVTFNNPEKRNSLSLASKERFVEVLAQLRHDPEIRVLIITGAGDKSFVGGTDLAQLAEFDLVTAEESSNRTHRMCDAVRTFPVPVIARINGYCFGSGMELAACADMRVAADDAKFGMPETRLGLPSGMEASVLPRLIGWGKACELVLTGDHIDAAEAYRIHYLQRLVPRLELDAAVESWVKSLLLCGPEAVRLQKRLILDWALMSITDGARAGIKAVVDAYRTDEPRKYITKFLQQKRK